MQKMLYYLSQKIELESWMQEKESSSTSRHVATPCDAILNFHAARCLHDAIDEDHVLYDLASDQLIMINKLCLSHLNPVNKMTWCQRKWLFTAGFRNMSSLVSKEYPNVNDREYCV